MFVLRIAFSKDKHHCEHNLVLEIACFKEKHSVKPHFLLEIGIFKEKHRLKAHFLLEIGISRDKARPEVALVLETVVFQDKLTSVTSAGERGAHQIVLICAATQHFEPVLLSREQARHIARYLAKTHSEILSKG